MLLVLLLMVQQLLEHLTCQLIQHILQQVFFFSVLAFLPFATFSTLNSVLQEAFAKKEVCSTVRNLGVVFDQDASFNVHIKQIYSFVKYH